MWGCTGAEGSEACCGGITRSGVDSRDLRLMDQWACRAVQTPLWLTPNIRRVKVCFSCFLNLTLSSLLCFFVPCSLYRGPGTRFFLMVSAVSNTFAMKIVSINISSWRFKDEPYSQHASPTEPSFKIYYLLLYAPSLLTLSFVF